MSTLAELAGIEMAWADDGTLTFGDDVVVDEAFTRPLERLRSVALEPEACTPPDRVQYWMYNGTARRADRDRLLATGMRYELTLMFPRSIGRERAKTLGHLHTGPADSRLNYPEICEVLHGTAHFLFQLMDMDAHTAHWCALIEAHPGDKVIIPPNLHHLTINAGDEPLLFSDVIPLAVQGIYEPFARMRGAAYLNTLDAGIIPNPHYKAVAPLQRLPAPVYPGLEAPLYQVFVDNPDALAWMTHPERFAQTFPDIWERIGEFV